MHSRYIPRVNALTQNPFLAFVRSAYQYINNQQTLGYLDLTLRIRYT